MCAEPCNFFTSADIPTFSSCAVFMARRLLIGQQTNMPREVIDTGTGQRRARRNEDAQFNKVGAVGKWLAADAVCNRQELWSG